MTTLVAFQPSQFQAPQFQATLDGQPYNIIITWMVGAGLRSGWRYYVNCYDQNGNWIFTQPLVGSPPDYDISLTAGYFTTTLVYRVGTQMFEIGS